MRSITLLALVGLVAGAPGCTPPPPPPPACSSQHSSESPASKASATSGSGSHNPGPATYHSGAVSHASSISSQSSSTAVNGQSSASPTSNPAGYGHSSASPTSGPAVYPHSSAGHSSVPIVKPSTPPSGGDNGTSGGNPFSGHKLYANSFYAGEVLQTAIPSLSDSSLAAAASAVAKVPSFYWLDKAEKVPTIADLVTDAQSNGADLIPLVVYDLPDRDCAALASNGEYSIADNGEANYHSYIDGIKEQISAASSMNFVLIIEPDSLGNLVTNMNVQKCANAASTYQACVNYAITQLNLPNVAMYLDAGHAGWLGWTANLPLAAKLFAGVYTNASKPASVRGLATNVANYNAWMADSPAPYTQGDDNYDESLYVHALSPLLESSGWAGAKFITDTSRNGVQPTKQQQWGDWCNVIGTGFGVRPSADTGDDLLDAFVWVKPGGESDGTSDTTAERYDAHCGMPDALAPAPEAGTWFQAYFEQLLTNANPSF